MPPFSVAWLVTQTDNGRGIQLKKSTSPKHPTPPTWGRSTSREMTVTQLFASSAMSDR